MEKFRQCKREAFLHSDMLSRKQGAGCFPRGADARERFTGLALFLPSSGLQKDPCIATEEPYTHSNHITALLL